MVDHRPVASEDEEKKRPDEDETETPDTEASDTEVSAVDDATDRASGEAEGAVAGPAKPPEEPDAEDEEPDAEDEEPDDDADAREPEPARALPLKLVGGAILAVLAGLLLWKSQGDDGPSPSSSATAEGPLTALMSDEATLACPIFSVSTPSIQDAGPLGAAAGSVACEVLFAYTGRNFEHHRPPAVLMGFGVQASDGAIPYTTDHRSQTLEAAKASTGWLDGSITVGARDFTVEVTLMAGDEPLGPPGKATHASLQVAALDAASAAAEATGLKPVAELPDELSSLYWTCPDGTCFRDVMRLGFAIDASPHPLEMCRTVVAKYPSAAASLMHNHCAEPLRRAGDDVPTLEKLLDGVPEPIRSARLSMGGGAELSPDELAAKAASAENEGTKVIVGVAVALARARKRDDEAVKVVDELIAKVPRYCLSRMVALYASPVRTQAQRARAGATWCPEAETFWHSLHGEEEVEPAQAQQSQRICYALSGRRPSAALEYGQTLLREVLRDPETRAALEALAKRWKGDTTSPLVAAYLSARVLQLDGKLGAAETLLSKQLLTASDFGHSSGSAASLSALMMGFELTGGADAFTTAFLDKFVLGDPPKLAPDAPVTHLVRLCTYASEEKGLACIDRLRQLTGQGALMADGTFPESFATGAEFFLKGDDTTAVETWRADVMAPEIRPHLRSEAFDAAKDPDLAKAIDASRIKIDGSLVSARHIRAANRAAASGDDDLSQRLAREVVKAFANADVKIAELETLKKLAKAEK